jgi:hypothetical protein
MNRRQFIKTCFLSGIALTSFATPVSGESQKTKFVSFPFMFPIKDTNRVEISEFKADNFFEKLWQDWLQFIK